MSLRNYLTQFFLLMIKKIEFGNARRQSCLCDDIEAYLCGVLVDAAFFGVSDKRTFFTNSIDDPYRSCIWFGIKRNMSIVCAYF